MTSRDFCFWLQGFLEINSAGAASDQEISPAQVEIVRSHLNLVFVHEIDPSMGGKAEQEKLQQVHDGKLTLPQAAESLRQLLNLGFNDLTSCATLIKSPNVPDRLKEFLVDWYGFDGDDDCAEVTYIKDAMSSLDNRIKQDQTTHAKKPVMRC